MDLTDKSLSFSNQLNVADRRPCRTMESQELTPRGEGRMAGGN